MIIEQVEFGDQEWWPCLGSLEGFEMDEWQLRRVRIGWGGSGKRFAICKLTNEMDSKISCNQLDSYSDAAS